MMIHPLSHQLIMRDTNNHPTQLVNYIHVFVNCNCYHLSLAPDADVSTKPLTDQERQQQSSNTIGNLCTMLVLVIIPCITYH